MTASWPSVKLERILEERRETPSPESILTGNIPIISKIGFDDGKIQLRTELETKTNMILVRPGDLVVSGINAAKGAIAIYGDNEPGPIAATIHYGAYAPRKNQVDARYLWWLLRSQYFRDILLRHVPGGIKTELKATRLLQIPIPLPPFPEQLRVVAQIDALAAKINEARRLRHQATEEADFLSYAAMKDARLRIVSTGIPLTRLGDITEVTSGGTPSREISTFWGGNIPWIKTGELLDGDITGAEEHITSDGIENSSAKIFPEQTILVALYGQGQTRGRTGRLLISAATNQACCAILPNPARLDPKFVQYWLRSLYRDLRETSHGGAQPNWNGGIIKDLQIAIPPQPVQRQMVAYLDGLQAQMGALKRLQAETAAELAALLPTILDKGFKGDL